MTFLRPPLPKLARFRPLLRRARLVLLVGAAACGLGYALQTRTPPDLGAEIIITPPDYLKKPALVLASEGPKRTTGASVAVPEGSKVTVRVTGAETTPPHLVFDGDVQSFTQVGDDLVATIGLARAKGEAPHTLRLRKDGKTLGLWTVRVTTEPPPQIGFEAPPTQTGPHSLRLSYEARADLPITEILAEIAPTSPDTPYGKETVPLTTPQTKRADQTIFVDLSGLPLAGKPVTLTLLARDAAGHEGQSDPTSLVLPERPFKKGMARTLLKERARLETAGTSEEKAMLANELAVLARQVYEETKDPLTFLALRGSAVRLVLTPTLETTRVVRDLLWHVAARIEDGGAGTALEKLRTIDRSLVDAIEKENNRSTIDMLLLLSHQALQEYLDQLQAKTMPGPTDNLTAVTKYATEGTAFTANELHGRIEALRLLALKGDRQTLRQELAAWQDALEVLHVAEPKLTPEQSTAMEMLVRLRALTKEQEILHKQTASLSTLKKKISKSRHLLERQKAVLKRIKALGEKLAKGPRQERILRGEKRLEQACQNLKAGAYRAAAEEQAKALQEMRSTEKELMNKLHTLSISPRLPPAPGA